jgi:hypothetical protein
MSIERTPEDTQRFHAEMRRMDKRARTLVQELITISAATTKIRTTLSRGDDLVTWIEVDQVVAEVRAACDRIDNLMPRTVASAAQPVEPHGDRKAAIFLQVVESLTAIEHEIKSESATNPRHVEWAQRIATFRDDLMEAAKPIEPKEN